MTKHRDNEGPIIRFEKIAEERNAPTDAAEDTEPDTIFAKFEPEPLEELLRFLLKPDNETETLTMEAIVWKSPDPREPAFADMISVIHPDDLPKTGNLGLGHTPRARGQHKRNKRK